MARRKVRISNSISSFTSQGKRAPDTFGKGIPASQLGHFDPATGRVYQHPRIQNDTISGPRVRVTNPRAALAQGRERTASLGMGAVGQVGRTQAVGAASE